MSASILNAQNLSKVVGSAEGKLTILHDLSLDLARGDSLAIVGSSGSGKSTLLGLLAGLDQPSGGEVRLAGHALGDLDEDQRARVRAAHVGFVFQSFQLLDSLDALENVMLPLELEGRADARQRARELLERVGLGQRLGHYPRQLSGGEQQRVAIARAFAAERRAVRRRTHRQPRQRHRRADQRPALRTQPRTRYHPGPGYPRRASGASLPAPDPSGKRTPDRPGRTLMKPVPLSRLLSLAGRQLFRESRSGELRVLFFALLIAVASSTAIGYFSARLNGAMLARAAEFPRRRPGAQRYPAGKRRTDRTRHPSGPAPRRQRRVFQRDRHRPGHPAQQHQGVGDRYPLRGQLKSAAAPFAAEQAGGRPQAGEVWVESRLLVSLDLKVGDSIEIGRKPLRIARILTYEPDRAGDFYSLTPRA